MNIDDSRISAAERARLLAAAAAGNADATKAAAFAVIDRLRDAGEPLHDVYHVMDLCSSAAAAAEAAGDKAIEDFLAYLPSHQYIYVPTCDLWPAASVNGRVSQVKDAATGKPVKAADYLDKYRAVEQMTWHPAHPPLIRDKVVQGGGWIEKPGATVFNLYRPPIVEDGNPTLAERWRDHLRALYPAEHQHIEYWFAHLVQRPGEKCNHALVLGGTQGIGKDSLIEPVKRAVGAWNCTEISPAQMLGRFNGFVRSVLLRVSEARDLGDVDRFAFYDHAKTLIAAPPDVLRCDEKNLREHPVFNVVGVLITTNHLTDGIYLPSDDRRHFVAWSEATKDAFSSSYWTEFHDWLNDGGCRHVAAYLRSLDLSDFNAKAPPPKTSAFHAVVHAGQAPEDSELRDVLDALGNPAAVTLTDVLRQADVMGFASLAVEMGDRRHRRSLPHKFERADYVVCHNIDATDGLFKISGKRQAVYARRDLSFREQIAAARGCGQAGQCGQ